MTDKGIHYYAIRHNVTGLWWADGKWTDTLWLADVWSPDDMDDEGDSAIDTEVAHWQAFTWVQYCEQMEDRPPLAEWFQMLDAR